MGYRCGISLRDRPRSYLKLLDELIDKQVIKTEPEFNGIPFSVSYETNAFFHSEYLSNIAHDGLFVPCSDPLPELQSKTRVGLKLLESMAMYMVEGLVIYHRAPNECGDGEEPGFAIQIQDYLTAPKKRASSTGCHLKQNEKRSPKAPFPSPIQTDLFADLAEPRRYQAY